ncbi:uncharacterized protein LOC100370566 [Saccoglossus kowalevskii]|uniref:Uncharacterized protein LOC100370566 n=1 Tax=Saccoglossus kowalevskii TaxID=10224 RepID=A0ABM0GUB2_SACKO|nr:PREDICTED: uncharacterized protein LOC100370566 [Saccoglossus kowalevskii]
MQWVGVLAFCIHWLICIYANAESSAIKGHLEHFGSHRQPLEGIDVVETKLNSSVFYTNYVQKSKPLLIKGGGVRWPATELWKDEEYLIENFGEEVFRVDLRKVWDDEHPPRMNMFLKDFLKTYKEKAIYLDSPFPSSELLHDAYIPSVLECSEFSSKIESANLLFSSGNTSYVLHQDGYENIITLVAGKKKFFLAHPRDSHKLYANQFTTLPGLSPVLPDKVDMEKFPLVADLEYYEVEMEAGDQLYVPMFWWHQVRSFNSPNIAVSLWFYIFDHDEDLTRMNIDPDINIEESSLLYLKYIAKQPDTIKCKKMSKNKKLAVALKENRPEEYQNANVMIETPPDKLMLSGYTLPVLGFGTGLLSDKTYQAVKYALEVGYRLIDTSQGYPRSEEDIGKAIKDSGIPRSEIIIVDKVHPKYLGYHSTIKSVEESLKKLQTDYVDIFLIHSIDCDDFLLTCDMDKLEGTWKDTWKALEALTKEGKIRSIGVSNFDLPLMTELMEIATIPVSIVQNQFDVLNRDDDVRKFCSDHNIQYMGYSSLGRMWTFEHNVAENPVLNNPVIQHIAISQQRTVPNIALRWAIYHDVIVIPSSANEHHILTNIQSLEVILNEDEMEEMDNIPVIDLDKLDNAMDLAERQGKLKNGQFLTNSVIEFITTYMIDVNTNDPNIGTCTTENCGENENKYTESAQKEYEWVKPDKPGSAVTLYEKVNLEDETIYFGAENSYMYAMDAKTGNIKWKFQTSYSDLASCAVFSQDGRTIYFGGEDAYFYALSAVDGSVQWTFETDGSIISSPVLGVDGSIYFGSVDGNMYALYPNGQLKWKKDLIDEIWASPDILNMDDKEYIYITVLSGYVPNIFALDGKDGSTIFSINVGGDGLFASPRLSLDNSTVYLCEINGRIHARDSRSGQLKEIVRIENAEINSTPAVNQNAVIVATSSGNVIGLHLDSLNTIWETFIGGNIMSSPYMGPNNKIYIGSGDGRILAINETDGALIWSKQTGKKDVWCTPRLDNDGRLFIGAFDEHMYALNATTGEEIWKTKIGAPIIGSPLITSKYRQLTPWEIANL